MKYLYENYSQIIVKTNLSVSKNDPRCTTLNGAFRIFYLKVFMHGCASGGDSPKSKLMYADMI